MTSLSIITVCLNSSHTIGDCLRSVGSQSHLPEHIVIDGGSSDGTQEAVGRFPHVARLVSEPDRGMYDAMNKGIALATGEVVGILNSDDVYADPEVLGRVAQIFSDPTVDACYGDLVYVSSRDPGRIVRSWKSGRCTPESFYRGWMPPHPTFFVRRSLYQRHGGFRTELGSAADYELMLRFLLRYRAQAAYLPEVLVRMRSGGVSNASLANRFRANRMDRKAWLVNQLTPLPWTLILKPLSKIGQFRLLPRREQPAPSRLGLLTRISSEFTIL